MKNKILDTIQIIDKNPEVVAEKLHILTDRNLKIKIHDYIPTSLNIFTDYSL